MNFKENLKKGALNLILNCAELSPHKKVLIVAENEKFGWYDKFVAKIVQKYCTELEIAANLLMIEEPTEENSYKIQKLSSKYDCIIYFSRLGDLKRFENVHSCKVVMSYARNINMLASQFGTTNYKIHLDFKKSIDEVFINTKKLKISCPSGTDVTGNCYKVFSYNNDVAIKRFPMVVHSPISANLLSGVVVVEKFLTSSGSSFYSPSNIKLNEKVKFYIKNGHIQSVIGNEKDVCNIKKHYDYVSNKFEIKRDIVHSLHSGIHNGLLSKSIKLNNPDYWSNTVFANPNYLHFHTCGDYAPGEICWILKNQTIRVDDLNLWQNGNIMYNNFPLLMKCIDKWPELLTLLKNKTI